MRRLNFVQIADDAFEVSVRSPHVAQQIAAHLRENSFAEDVVAGLQCVTVSFDPLHSAEVSDWLSALSFDTLPKLEAPQAVEIEITYGGDAGPDLDRVCDALSLTRKEFVALHTSCEHVVDMIGFTPGFAYISGVPQDWKVPRLETPRPRLPAGSVGISGASTGLYALDGPGGWPIVGRTNAKLFDPSLSQPFLLSPGMAIKFRAA